MTWNQIYHYRIMLEDLLIETTTNLEMIGQKLGELSTDICPDENDQASIESEKSLLLAQAGRGGKLITEIKQALKLLENGEYGICTACGDDINPRRLLVHPTAKLCAQCQESLEQRAGNTGQYNGQYNDFNRNYA